jgi:crotonobetainyl-CoA:carnitine CoA-transferase CaiB-like acyl-CoA transferase
VKYAATPANIRRHPPRLGEHNPEILAELDRPLDR